MNRHLSGYSVYMVNQEGFLQSDFPHKKIKYFLFTISLVFNTEKIYNSTLSIMYIEKHKTISIPVSVLNANNSS